MFLKSVVFFLVHVFITCTKCHSYFLKNKYFGNVFFINSHIKGFSKNDEKKVVKVQRNKRRGVHRWVRKGGGIL